MRSRPLGTSPIELAFVLLLAAPALAAQDLSGAWVPVEPPQREAPHLRALSVSLPGRSLELSIRQEGDVVTIDQVRRSRDAAETFTTIYRTDGVAQVVSRPAGPELVAARWEGDRLVLEAAGLWRETWSRSEADRLEVVRERTGDGVSRTFRFGRVEATP